MNDVGFGLWFLVIINTVIVIGLAASFFHPKTKRDWRAMGAFSAFLVALFTEMYGFPLTLYLLSGWLGNRFPGLTVTHRGGHIWNDLIGWKADPHVSPFHIASYAALIVGFVIIAKAWTTLWRAQTTGELATTGLYRHMRHPQYAGFMLIMIGFLLMWPTIPTLVMFPVLIIVYRRLAFAEERETRAHFGAAWDEYAGRTPPRARRREPAPVPERSGSG